VVVGVIGLLIGLAVLVACVWSFFLRRHGEAIVPADGWQRTDEVFIDPRSNQRMRVWVDPRDNSRHYVADT
jgi:hypothetical protein